MKILILNWRDIKNPSRGGAELLTHELAKRLIKKGHEVFQFSQKFTHSKRYETVDGIEIIRYGAWWSVHFFAMIYYVLFLRSKIDIIIDEVHWFPYFSKIYAPKKTILLVCEVANKLFSEFLPFPVLSMARLVERIYLLIYRNTPTLAISPSTKKALIMEGFRNSAITVIPLGVNIPDIILTDNKEKNITLMFLGRLTALKGVKDTIIVLKNIKKEFSHAKLWIVGSGSKEYTAYLKEIILDLKLHDSVVFYGFVSEKKKFELLAKAHLLLLPSKQEGWGLVIPEAALVKTPSVAYNVEGVRDIIINNKTGLLVESNPVFMAKEAVKLLKNKVQYKDIQHSAFQNAKKYNWDNTLTISLKVINEVYNKNNRAI